MLCLNDLAPGHRGRVKALLHSGAMRRRLMDLGLTPHAEVTCLGRSPGGDPSAYLIRGAVIALRARDCAGILLEPELREAVPWA